MRLFIIKKLFTFSSFSGVLMFYLVGKNIDIPFIKCCSFLQNNTHFKHILIVLTFVAFARFTLCLLRMIPSRDTCEVKSIKPIEGTYMPVYIGLFVVALEMSDSITSGSIVLMSCLYILWNCFESVSYFNPFFMLFGYRFYEVVNSDGVTITVITKRRDLKMVKKIKNLMRLNNFTYFERL